MKIESVCTVPVLLSIRRLIHVREMRRQDFTKQVRIGKKGETRETDAMNDIGFKSDYYFYHGINVIG